MILHNDIANAIGKHLHDAALGYPIHWQGDENAPPARPYILFEYLPTGGTDRALTGGSEAVEGYCMASLMGEGGGGPMVAPAARSSADEIRAAFIASPRRILSVTGGKVLIRSARLLQGYHDGAGYRVPVRIDFRAF